MQPYPRVMTLTQTTVGTTPWPTVRSTARRLRLGLLFLVVVVVACATTAQRVSQNAEAQARATHHSSLAEAAGSTLNDALSALVKVPVSQRLPGVLPGAPALGSIDGQSDGDLVQTTLLVSKPDTVVAKVEIRSDGYSTTLVERYTASATGTGVLTSCSFGDMGTTTDCDALLA
jgi:alkanesulfonate monooxygenase SsuD/methylene tetrahydromethanopterin reductase-like flavin-dependent oxidoreductase (luciferase family)